MVGQARQTFERRQLGMTLRRLRDEAGKTQQDAADVLGKVRSRVVSLEDGSATATPEDLSALLDCYQVAGEERETLLALAAQARKRTKRRTHVDVLPNAYRRFADLEASSAEINCYESGLIPGLLQSPGYVRAVHAECEGIWWRKKDAEREDRLAFRTQRQAKVFEQAERRMLRFVITEDALHANMGEPEVMREQLAHLLGLIGEHRDLTVRILGNDVFGNPARGNSLLIFCFGERGAPIGYSAAALGPSTYYDHEKDTAAMLRAFYRVWELALSRKESRRLIERILEAT
jgi:transcriptional regulator with XRE-family HTH domain